MTIDRAIAELRERIAEYQNAVDTCGVRQDGQCFACERIERDIALMQAKLDQFMQDKVRTENTYSLIEQQ